MCEEKYKDYPFIQLKWQFNHANLTTSKHPEIADTLW